jgi:Ca-activated chloride channel family protein
MRRVLVLLSASLLACSTTSTLSGPASQAPATAVVAGDPSPDAVALAVASDAPNPNAPWVGAAPASDVFLAGSSDSFMAVWVDVPKTTVEKHAPAAVALVIDTSGSMAQGNKIAHAREAATRMVSSLRDGDIVSLHAFSDDVRELVAPTRLDAQSRQRIAGTISELSASGGTNLFEGVRQAGLAAMASPSTHSVRRVVLISDGNATVGTTSVDLIGNLGERAADRGVQVTSVGVGLDYNEKTLNQLSIRSAGRLYHVTESKVLPEIVESEIALLKSSRATNARINIVPAPGVTLLGVQGSRATSRPDGSLEVPLGSMFAGQHREFIVRVRVNAPAEGSHPLASVRFAFADPTDGNLERLQETVARFDGTTDGALVAARKNLKAQGVFAMLAASDATSQAAFAFENDDFRGADDRLREAETQLKSMAAVAAAPADKKRFEESAARVSQQRSAAAGAAAAPAPARAAAKRKMSLESNDAAMDFSGH